MNIHHTLPGTVIASDSFLPPGSRPYRFCKVAFKGLTGKRMYAVLSAQVQQSAANIPLEEQDVTLPYYFADDNSLIVKFRTKGLEDVIVIDENQDIEAWSAVKYGDQISVDYHFLPLMAFNGTVKSAVFSLIAVRR